MGYFERRLQNIYRMRMTIIPRSCYVAIAKWIFFSSPFARFLISACVWRRCGDETAGYNLLSGIDHMPVNDTWKYSTLRDQKIPTHPQSQLASVTWFNGTLSWFYYQDVNSQLREFGLDEYRDVVWRDGSLGPLGQALSGTEIGASRCCREMEVTRPGSRLLTPKNCRRFTVKMSHILEISAADVAAKNWSTFDVTSA
jgi:hypothetical protein